ncbi:hypothetical protein SDJN02_23843, partial [Cucurbita argyrosperma subsp. argyrosperma]
MRCVSDEAEPRRGCTSGSHIDWRRERVTARTMGSEGPWTEGFHTLVNGGLFSFPTNVGHHNPPPSAPSVLAVPSSNRCGTTPKSTPFGPSVLTGTPPHTYPIRGTARRLTHSPMSGTDTICNGPDPPLADIVAYLLTVMLVTSMPPWAAKERVTATKGERHTPEKEERAGNWKKTKDTELKAPTVMSMAYWVSTFKSH